MRRRFATLMIALALTACAGEQVAQAPPTQLPRLSPTPQLTVLPTITPVVTQLPPTPIKPTATVDLSPITITPLPFSPVPLQTSSVPTATADVELPTAEPPTIEPTLAGPTATPEPQPPSADQGAILFTRNGAVWRYDFGAGSASKLLATGEWYRASPDGSQLAFVRDGTLYLAATADSEPRRIAKKIIEPPVWAPDGRALAVSTGTRSDLYPLACGPDSTLVIIELPAAKTRTVGEGCQPAWDARSRRIAYVTPQIGDVSEGFNTVGLVNRQGSNGWTPVSAPVVNANFPDPRRIFYAPFWAADDSLYAFGFVGYRTLSDISTLEQIDPINGGTTPLGVAFDVVPASVRALPDGAWVAYTTAGAKGSTVVTAMPTVKQPTAFNYIGATIEVQTSAIDGIEYGTAPAWSPTGAVLALVYCQNADYVCQPGDRASVRLFDPATGLTTELFNDVDPDSDLEWTR